MTNPLELYEVVQRVGYFIQIHKRREDHRYWHFDFCPKDLISCMQVSKTWRQALTPLLWRVYNEEEMTKLEVPLDLCQANSPYFRFLDIDTPWPTDTLKSTQLRQLILRGQVLKSSLGLLQSNRLLTWLDLKLYDGTVYSDIQEAFDSVTWLRTFQFHGGETLDPDHLATVIFNNQDLRELLVSGITGFERIVSNGPLIHLTILDLDTLLDGNPGLIQLIRFCPNLEAIWFHGCNTFHTCPFEAIAMNLRECCPKISSIRSRDNYAVISYEQVVSEDELVALIQSSRRLIHFEMPILDLSARVCSALVDSHAASLKLLRLNLYADDPNQTLSNAGKILEKCFSLEKFVLNNDCYDWQPLDCFLLLEQPWGCKSLGALTLRGVRYFAEDGGHDQPEPFEKDPSDVVPTVVDAEGNIIRTANATDLACREHLASIGEFVKYIPTRMLGKYGWVVQVSSGLVTERQDLCSAAGNRLVARILERTIPLAKIRKVTINHYRYCKAGSPELRQGK